MKIFTYQYKDMNDRTYIVKCIAKNSDDAFFDLRKQLPSGCKCIKLVEG